MRKQLHRIKEISLRLLHEGLSPRKVALAIAAGITFGVFPIYGPVTLIVLAFAWLTGLNKPITVAALYSMSFVKPLLIIPFLRLGEFLFRAEPMGISLADLSRRFAEDALGTLHEFGWSFVHAAAGWLAVVPILVVAVYAASLSVVARWNRARLAVAETSSPVNDARIEPTPRGRVAGSVVPAALLLVSATLSAEAFWGGGPAEELFEPTKVVEGIELRRHGIGLLRYKRLIPVYDAALYLEAGKSPAAALDGGARRLEVVYRVEAKAERYNAAGERVLAETMEPAALAALRERLDLINSWYPDPAAGDRCAITYLPGKGTQLSFNGEVLGVVPGADFAEAYFSIWLGEEPAYKPLRDNLLNGARYPS